MKAYILKSGVRISPFEDPPEKVQVLTRSVQDRQDEILGKLGLEPVRIDTLDQVRDEEYILFRDYVYCSRLLLKKFLKRVTKHGQSRRLALEANPQIEMALPMQDLDVLPPSEEGGEEIYAFDLFYVRDMEPDLDNLRALPPEVVAIRMKVVEVDPPSYVHVEQKNRIGMTGCYCMHLKHWTHIYLLNFAALTGLPFEWFPRKLLWLLWRVITAFSLNPFKIAKRLVIKGKKCSIHPTAVVEASVLGNGVSVGPGAVVRGCYLGDGVRISESAFVLGSIVGEGASVGWNSGLNLSLLYPQASVGIPGIQAGVVGRESFFSTMALPLDIRFEGGYVSVRHKGKTVKTRLTTLGPCLGHRVRVGGAVIVNSGREIPNGVSIVPDPASVLSRLPEPPAEPGLYAIRGGTLVPMQAGEKCPGSHPETSEPT